MKTIFCLVFTIFLGVSAEAADWEIWKKTPAQIEVLNMKSVPLTKSTVDDKNGWIKVSDNLLKYGAVIFMPNKAGEGIADITVTEDGYLFLACNYDYQGNPSGDWQKDVWDEKKFKAKGWHLVSKNELGGILAKGDNKEQTVFMKKVKKGENLRLRCNKYDPPFPILLAKP